MKENQQDLCIKELLDDQYLVFPKIKNSYFAIEKEGHFCIVATNDLRTLWELQKYGYIPSHRTLERKTLNVFLFTFKKIQSALCSKQTFECYRITSKGVDLSKTLNVSSDFIIILDNVNSKETLDKGYVFNFREEQNAINC